MALLADAVAVTDTVPVAPAAHCTVTVPIPLEITVAMVMGGFVGLSTTNCPVYGIVKVRGALKGGKLNVPVAVKTTPFGLL